MPRQQGQSNAHEHLLSGHNTPPTKPHSVSSGNNNAPQGQPPTLFLRRTFVLISIPPLVTVYFFIIWRWFLERDWDPVVKYGWKNEIWLFYSWFLLGVFGLEWSKHGLVGVEAAMLQRPFWKAPNVATLLFHSEASWSGPGGWLKCLKRLFLGRPRLTHRLWYVLALLSFLVFVALPISGLCLELSDGYIPQSSVPMVIGTKYDWFQRRNWQAYWVGLTKGWEIGSPTIIPGIGILYTPEYVKRKDFSNLGQIPNTMPLADGIPEMFFSPQAQVPVSGRPWGLLTGYNCSMVKDASEFTILTQKPESVPRTWTESSNGLAPYITLETPDNRLIYVFDSSQDGLDRNLYGYIEMGTNAEPSTYNGSEPLPSDPSSFDRAIIFEYALWQTRNNASYEADDQDYAKNFTDTINPGVKGLGSPIITAENGSYVVNETFFRIKVDDLYPDVYNSSTPFLGFKGPLLDRILSLAPPIGIRCVVTSAMGYATIDAKKSTFGSFEQTGTAGSAEEVTFKLSEGARKTLLGRYMQIFTSSNSPDPVTESNSVWYQGFIQPQILQKSIMVAFAFDALHIMYDGTYGFGSAWENNNLTSSKPGKIVTPGVIPAIVPAILFGLWALGCIALGLAYGFCRRWSDSLDGYSFFRFGVHLADETRGKPDFASARGFEDSETLWQLDGLVGDMNGRRRNGNIMMRNMNRDGGYSSGYGG
ncbi:Fc.00g028900.m01.CDS01 [Cosmosporella sp. VM-42]